jgi:pimeloyl-ACP methyl ester carboxylesterase
MVRHSHPATVPRTPIARQARSRAGIALAATALLSTSTPSIVSASPSISVTTSSRPAALEWTSCGEGLECSTLTVPLDHSDPRGATIDIAVVRRPATDQENRIGSLVTNPGGPGSSGVEFVAGNPDRFPEQIRARYDIVSFDPRGVGASAPVRCIADDARLSFFNEFEASPASVEQWFNLVAQSSQLAHSCGAAAGDVLPFLDTASVAGDLDLLRAALGEKRLHYVGFSYGTYLGTMYAALFPKKVGSFVLDGAIDPHAYRDDPLGEAAVASGVLEATLQQFYAACAAQSSCPLGADPAPAVDELLTALDASPLEVETEFGVRTVTRGAVGIATFVALLLGPDSWPAFADSLQRAREGDGSGIVGFSGAVLGQQPDGSFNNGFDARTAIACADQNYPRELGPWVEAALRADTAGTFGSLPLSNYVPCAFWPVVTANPYTGGFEAKGAAPIVVIGTTDDVATPYEGAVTLADTLRSGVLLTNDGVGHTVYGQGNVCIDDAINAYLLEGTAPVEGTVCQG